MDEMIYTEDVERILSDTVRYAETLESEFITPEHLLATMLHDEKMYKIYLFFGKDISATLTSLEEYLNELEKIPEEGRTSFMYSLQMGEVFTNAMDYAKEVGWDFITFSTLVEGIGRLSDSTAAYLLKKDMGNDWEAFIKEVKKAYGEIKSDDSDPYEEALSRMVDEDYELLNSGKQENLSWKDLVVCINNNLEGRNPLVGRERELDRTIQILCRKDKNNPLHIGNPGVGKTALVYGLARLIEDGKVPDRLKGAKIYGLEIGSLIAGTQFRGDFEKRLKMIMEGLIQEINPILYIDEIHNLVGAGQTGEGSLDASNLLKPYLEARKIRFIGSTTYDEYKRYFERSKGLVRRFIQIDVAEPKEEEAIAILKKLKEGYERFHGVRYLPSAIEFAVKGSARFVNDRYLPDKAIDLIDEAGAYRHIHPELNKKGENVVDKELIAEILSKICKVDRLSLKEENTESVLSTLESGIKSEVFGQDEAVKAVAEAVMMSKAGLTEPDKPVASLLFVGPTGVGKTEVAKVLAKKLGIGFVRFDMSEYSEKHAVAKLIGSPAGYVGYEDGGLLTDAIRKTPDCVLLLDEIEKAHPDIYNILLQVMDYATLKDNKGNQADFRNVIFIMTSNSGARYASQASVGFASHVSAGEYMLSQVKKSFKPEFINRLSGTIVFHSMSREMASLILDKKLRSLSRRLVEKKVELALSAEAREYLLEKGFSPIYGGREIERVLTSQLKPLLMREILFGKLKRGGKALIEMDKEKATPVIQVKK